MELFLLRIPWGQCEVSLFIFWSLCVSQEVKSSISHALSLEITWECWSQGMQELQGWYQLAARSGPGCAISRCVFRDSLKQGVSCCPLSQHCGSGFAGASEPQSSVPFLFLQGWFHDLSFEPTARQDCEVQLRETPVPYSAKHQVLLQAIIARKTLIPNASKPRTIVLYW